MRIRVFVSLLVLSLAIGAALNPLPESPQELLGLSTSTPQWLVDVPYIANLDDPKALEYCFFSSKGEGGWTPEHGNNEAAVGFSYEIKEASGKERYKLCLTLRDGEKKDLPFTHTEGRFKLENPQGKPHYFKHKISFKKPMFQGASTVFYGHLEKRG